MTDRIDIFVLREGDRDLCMVVTCDVSAKIQNGNQLLEAVKRAVTNWVQTEDGKPIFDYAVDDLNIGDLASYGEYTSLHQFLANEGVENFEIIQPDRCNWNYDTPLVNMNDLPEGFVGENPCE